MKARLWQGFAHAQSAPISPLQQTSHPSGTAILVRLIPGTLLGVVLGGLLLWSLHRNAELVGALIRVEIGIESILLVSLHWYRLARGTQHWLFPEPLRAWISGGFAGISSTLAHAAGPIFAMYLLPLNVDRQMYVGLSALYFFGLNTAKLPAYWASGQFAHISFGFTVKFLPLVLLGAVAGRWLNRRMSDRLFTKVVYLVTFALGWYILADGILRLIGKSIS